jgi:uncharacterized protein
MNDLKKSIQYVLMLVVMFFIISISKIATVYTDYLWFSSLGFSKIFTVSLGAKLMVFSAVALFFFVFLIINLRIASKIQKSKWSFKMTTLIILIISLFQGLIASTSWMKVLQYLNQVPFNLRDPIFAKDISFYVFSLPFFLTVWNYLFVCILITTIFVGFYYFHRFLSSIFIQEIRPNVSQVSRFDRKMDLNLEGVDNSINFWSELSKVKKIAKIHMAILASLVFFLLAIRHYLSRFSIMYSEKGIVVGAGYTDIVVFLPLVKFLMVFAAVVAVVFYVWIFYFSRKPRLNKKHIVLSILVLYLLVTVIGGVVLPGIVQSLKVSPNEINLEEPYIKNNIEFTKIAYGLDNVEEKDFIVNQNINPQVLENAKETITNVRILDYRPLTTTYKQTQEIRLYYDLSGIDIDRYNINGKYTQVMLAPRELDQTQIAQNAKTWVNLHMVYSHGFGVVMSPVNAVTKEGLPNYFIKDIPPIYTSDKNNLRIDQPRIYYGEKDNNFMLVNTKTNEFDYPKGQINEYINYDGSGGVNIDSFAKKLYMAIRFADIKILFSSDITPESKIMFDRSIQTRISKITPFLMLDNDPYLVIDDGEIYWIQDAYTVTGNYPYSQKFNGINYIRNSVKIVVDAYDGDVTYYVMDKNDPLIQVIENIFPEQFKDFDDMPTSLKKHIRYPEDLFKIQSQIYTMYHMNDMKVFYNKEDAWQIPYELYGTSEKIQVEPYYIIMKLPGEDKEEFVLMTTFTPLKKDNMIAWLAARSDEENYGKLLLYKFPKDTLIYGPLQIEAKIDQDSEISQQLTLWSQQGSRVTRGNLLVIPIENNILYIEPLYIQAETGQLPELKRVLVSDGERVVMEVDLTTALQELFGKSSAIPITGTTTMADNKSQEDLIQDANIQYEAVLSAMNNNDWSAIGENFDRLGNTLASLNTSSE